MFLHKLFMRSRVPDSSVSDNATQFISKEFKGFCKMFMVEHITIVPYDPWSNGQEERFMETYNSALKGSSGGSPETALKQFLRVYRLTPNKNAPSAMTLTKWVFVWKTILYKLSKEEKMAGVGIEVCSDGKLLGSYKWQKSDFVKKAILGTVAKRRTSLVFFPTNLPYSKVRDELYRMKFTREKMRLG